MRNDWRHAPVTKLPIIPLRRNKPTPERSLRARLFFLGTRLFLLRRRWAIARVRRDFRRLKAFAGERRTVARSGGRRNQE